MEKLPPTIESLTIRRANVVDADKVRYRVYSTPSEFVAVIAESALMAVRASGIKVPYKIVRDIPGGDNGMMQAKNLHKQEGDGERVKMSLEQKTDLTQYFTELGGENTQQPIIFVPMGIAELQNKGMTRARILPVEMLHEIIEEHAKQIADGESVVEQEVYAEPEIQEEEAVREPELSPAEKLAELADEVLSATPPPPTIEPSGIPVLTPEEVEKLLNGTE